MDAFLCYSYQLSKPENILQTEISSNCILKIIAVYGESIVYYKVVPMGLWKSKQSQLTHGWNRGLQ